MTARLKDSLRKLLLHRDSRGVASVVLQDPLAVVRVAKTLASRPASTALIVTGFFVDDKPETDGPLGAVFLGAALVSMGWRVAFASRADCLAMLRACAAHPAGYHEFPILNEQAGTKRAREIIKSSAPDIVFTIEVSGRTDAGKYLNMRGADISDVTPPMDRLLLEASGKEILSVAMGDGGNEAGFGAAPAALVRGQGIEPCAVPASHLLVGSVSNWVVYVLLASLSRELGRRVSPLYLEERRLLKRLVALGAVDGFTGRPALCVDGRGAAEHQEFFRLLNAYRTA